MVKWTIGAGLGLLLSMTALGCTGGETGGDGGESFTETFVVSDSSVGTITLTVTSPRISVAATSGFKVEVKNQDGAPVENVQIACDTENGLALIEPTSGLELTDSFGSMSGVLGCEAPGSFRIGCRLPIGANRREFVTVNCEGDVPLGFEGFPGAGGGGLGVGDGGGVATSPGGDFNIIDIAFMAQSAGGSLAETTSIDVSRADCADPGDDPDCEAFGDDFVDITIRNNTDLSATVSSFNFTVPNANGAGLTFTSKTLRLSPIEIPPGTTDVIVNGFFTDVVSAAGTCGGAKRLPDASFTLPSGLGIRNVTFRVTLTNELGESFTITGRASVSIDAFDLCP